MKLAIIGSRTFNDYNILKEICDKLNIDEIISGGAKGADSLAERYANEKNIPITIFYPDWNKYGKRAGFLRNNTIINYSDEVLAFWNGISKGTNHSISIARKQNKPVTVIRF
jgi:predicted Rossmann fold nucleotide-binding protein DprA/Smf involved in DNA uptake